VILLFFTPYPGPAGRPGRRWVSVPWDELRRRPDEAEELFAVVL